MKIRDLVEKMGESVVIDLADSYGFIQEITVKEARKNEELLETEIEEVYPAEDNVVGIIIPFKYKIYGAYSESNDITFVMKDYIDGDGKIISTEVVGFVYGNEVNNEELLRENIGKLKAAFDGGL